MSRRAHARTMVCRYMSAVTTNDDRPHVCMPLQEGDANFNVILLEDNRSIVLDKTMARDCNAEILQRHRIATNLQL